MTVLPVPTLDHVVVNARDDLDAAAALYRRLGFLLTPRGRHTLGSINHLAMFGTDYLELIGVPADAPAGLPPMEFPPGLNAVVFGTEDADATHAALAAAAVPVGPPMAFSRPVALPDGPRDAAFRTVTIPPGTVASGRLYFCQHLTRDLVWRDEWRRHPNGVVGVDAVLVAARAPGALGGLLGRMFGPDFTTLLPERGEPARASLAAGLTRIEIVPRAELAARYGPAMLPPDDRAEIMAVLVLRTASLAATAAALVAGGIEGATAARGRIVVPASAAMGTTIVFQAAPGDGPVAMPVRAERPVPPAPQA